MKKTYLQPETYVVKVNVSSMMMQMMTTSIRIDGTKGGDDAFVKEDNSWDIWGSAEDDED